MSYENFITDKDASCQLESAGGSRVILTHSDLGLSLR